MTAIHPQPEAHDTLTPLTLLGDHVARRAWHAWGSVAPWTWHAFQPAPLSHGLALTAPGVSRALQRSAHALASGEARRRMGSLQPDTVARFATAIADRMPGETIAAKYLPRVAATEKAWTDLPLAGAGQPDSSTGDGFVASSLFETEALPGTTDMREGSQPPDGLPAPASTGIAALELMRARSQSMAQRATAARSQAARLSTDASAHGQRRTFSRVEELPSSPDAPAQTAPDAGAHALGQGVSAPPSSTGVQTGADPVRYLATEPGAAATPLSRTVPSDLRAETDYVPQRGPTPEASEPIAGVSDMMHMPTRGSARNASDAEHTGDIARGGTSSGRMQPPVAHVQPKRLSVDLPLAAPARQASGAAQRPQRHLPEMSTAAGVGMAQPIAIGDDSRSQEPSLVQPDARQTPWPPAETAEDAQRVRSTLGLNRTPASGGRHASAKSAGGADRADEPASPDVPGRSSRTTRAHSDHAPGLLARAMRMALAESDVAQDQPLGSEPTVRTSAAAPRLPEPAPQLARDERVQRALSEADLNPSTLPLRRMHTPMDAGASDVHDQELADSGREPFTARSRQPRGEVAAEEASWSESPSLADGAARDATLAANPFEGPLHREHVLVLARPSRPAPRSVPADTDGAPVVQRAAVSEMPAREIAGESSAPARAMGRSEGSGTVVVAPDLEVLARAVLPIVKRLLAIERERTHGL